MDESLSNGKDATQNEIISVLHTILSNQDKIMYSLAKMENEINMLGKIIGKVNMAENVNDTNDKENLSLSSKPVSRRILKNSSQRQLSKGSMESKHK